jgi:hypothetical protein
MTTDLQLKIERGAKLSREISSLEKKKAELDQIKKDFRELAGNKDLELTCPGPGGATVSVEQKNDTVARVVADELLGKVEKLAGPNLFDLFTLHPSKGIEKNFELNAHKTLTKKAAESLVAVLTAPASPWVRFS